MPMTFDTYSNCAYGCVYCFSQYQRALGKSKKAYTEKSYTHVNPEAIKRMFLEPDSTQFGQYIKERRAMQWGGLSDQFDEFERKQGITLQLLRFFREIEYPICFSTKGVWWLKDARYTELFQDAKFWNVKFSIITLDETKARRIERGTPTPQERINAIETFSHLNAGGATLRLRPFIIGVSDPSFVELITRCGEAGATALSTEFFCLERRCNALKQNLFILNECCGFDVLAFYKKHSYSQGYLRLNRNVKRPFVDVMEQTAKNIGMRFYVSDAHFKERCHNGSCCGLPESWNYSRGQFCEALVIAKENGTVSFSEIAKSMEYLKEFKFGRAVGFNANTSEKRASFYHHSMYEYIRYIWNHPNTGQSPYRMFEGILKPTSVDKDNNVVYEYNPEKE